MGREKKGGSKVRREEEETLLSPSSFLPLFSSAIIILRYNSKYQSKRLYIYILGLQAFIRPFQLMYSENKKRDSGKYRIFIENTGSNNDIFNLYLPSQIIKIAFCQEPLGTQLQYNIHGFQACGQL